MEKLKLAEEKNYLAKGTGRRKSAIAQVTLLQGTGEFYINGKPSAIYMQQNLRAIKTMGDPLNILVEKINTEKLKEINIIVKVQGGGLAGQTDAIRLGIARAFCQCENEQIKKSQNRPCLKEKGYLTRDSRCKERKKYGLKKARKAPQYSKR
jgi:small subunit ribosomal protein S9